jgi:maleate isomerase
MMQLSKASQPKRVGVIMPPPNPTVEPEFQAALPKNMIMHASRFPVQPGDLAQRNEGYRAAYPTSVMGYGPLHLDAILVSCTGSSYLLGKAGDAKISADLQKLTGVPTITSSYSIQEALAALKIRRITLMSPYPAWLTSQSAEYWSGALQVDEVIQLGDGSTNAAYELDDDYVEQQLLKLTPRAQDSAVLLSGTGMPTLDAIGRVGSKLGVPVLSSNLCGIWWLLRATGLKSGSDHFNAAAKPLLPLL